MGDGRKRQIMPGLILIIVGLIFLLENFEIIEFDWGKVWTWMLILIGVAFWFGFLSDRRKIGLIMPGTVLLTIGIIFNLHVNFRWADMDNLWPFFILAPAFGFFAMYLLGKRDRGLLVPAMVLTIIGTVFLMTTIPGLIFVVAILLIGAGVMIIMSSDKKGPSRDDTGAPPRVPQDTPQAPQDTPQAPQDTPQAPQDISQPPLETQQESEEENREI
jgi:hypothetical protein